MESKFVHYRSQSSDDSDREQRASPPIPFENGQMASRVTKIVKSGDKETRVTKIIYNNPSFIDDELVQFSKSNQVQMEPRNPHPNPFS